MEQFTFDKGNLICEDELQLKLGLVHLRHYKNVLEIDPDGNGKCIVCCLHPRLYNDKALDDKYDWVVNKKTVFYYNLETRQSIGVKQDYNTTPKRKKKENIIWDVDVMAENILLSFGFERR